MVHQSNYEQIIREVKPTGNGAHIFAPKEWIGEEVIIVRKPKQSLKEEILSILAPYFENIIGVYLYGSRARGEASKDSDIDLFIITNKKIIIKKKGFEIINLLKEDIKDAIKISPVLIYSILAEAKPIINAELLYELKAKYQIKNENVKKFVENTKEIIKKNEELLDLDEKIDSKASSSVIYSLILRLRGIFIIQKLLKKEIYSNKEFERWLIKKGIKKNIYKKINEMYKAVKNEKTIKISINVQESKKILKVLKEEIIKLGNGEKKKET